MPRVCFDARRRTDLPAEDNNVLCSCNVFLFHGSSHHKDQLTLTLRRTEDVAEAVNIVPCRGRCPNQAEGWICSMTCQSFEAPESIESDRRAESNSGALESDESHIAFAMKELKNTGWYWGSLTANEAKEILQDATEGSFLVRNSSQRDYLFTISAVTSAGPTNLRIEYKHGKFKLDSVVLVKPKLKQFDSVVHLVEHYFLLSKISKTTVNSQPSASSNGTVQLLLTKPVYTATPSLKHLSRIAINRATRQIQALPLPNRLKSYLLDYMYNV